MVQAQTPFTPVPSTGLPYTIIISDVFLNNGSCPANTQIGAFTDTLCVGAEYYQGGQNIQIITWEGDPSQSLEGFSSGDSIVFKARVPFNGDFYLVNAIANITVGDGTFGFGTYTVSEVHINDPLLSIQVAWESKEQLQCYPNPFTSTIHISTDLPVEMVRIISMNGKILKSFNEKTRGIYTWNGKDNEGRLIASGLYIVEIVFQHRSIKRLIQYAK